MMDFKERAQQLLPRIVEWRRGLHQIPELAMDVPQTEAYICARLDELGVTYRRGVAGHGVVALIEGDKPGKVFGLRADCDGLPVREETGLLFASTNGCMHACGHDAHTAMGLGAAALLVEHRNELAGSVKIIFQPGEEGCPEGPGGAKRMINDGALNAPRPDVIVGLHIGAIWQENFEPGDVGYRFGSIMACMDRFEITVEGKGSHGAYPHESIDPISIGCQIVTELQTIVSREVDPLDPAVITIGAFQGGTAFNIIPDSVRISGTVRALTAPVREFLARRIEDVARSVAEGMRGSIEFYYGWEGPKPVVNDRTVTEYLKQTAEAVLGESRVKAIKKPSMGGEDFAFFLEQVPGTFFFLAGCNAAKGQTYPHHNARFDLDEDVLWVGPAVMATMAVDWLNDHR